jgi:hemolysin III
VTRIEVNTLRHQSAGEEFANSVSHGLGFVLAAVAIPVLGHLSLLENVSAGRATALGVFIATMLLLYLASALFHGLPPGRAKQFFSRLDHAAIYLFIAGTYTPFAEASAQGTSWPMLLLVWSMAIAGVFITLTNAIRNPVFSTGLYVVMGWLTLFSAVSCLAHDPGAGMPLLIAGGLSYTLGAGLFLLGHRWQYAHFVWHLFVMLGSGLHFAALLSRSFVAV